jgi:hypothetical protein
MESLLRLHWDGDLYSLLYARAQRRVIVAHPDVTFWTYTRSFRPPGQRCAGPRRPAEPHAVLSVDKDNLRATKPVLAAHPGVLVSTLSETPEDGERMLAELGRRRAPVCPEVIGKVPLIAARADRRRLPEPGEAAEGACVARGMCIVGRAGVRFPMTQIGRKAKAPNGSGRLGQLPTSGRRGSSERCAAEELEAGLLS